MGISVSNSIDFIEQLIEQIPFVECIGDNAFSIHCAYYGIVYKMYHQFKNDKTNSELIESWLKKHYDVINRLNITTNEKGVIVCKNNIDDLQPTIKQQSRKQRTKICESFERMSLLGINPIEWAVDYKSQRVTKEQENRKRIMQLEQARETFNALRKAFS